PLAFRLYSPTHYPRLALHQRVGLEARECLVGAAGRPVEEVPEVAARADRARVQKLVVDPDCGSLHVRSRRAELAGGEGRDGGLLSEVLVEAVEGPVALDPGLAEPEAAL